MRCVIDTETTGLPNAPWSRVVEIGAVLLDEAGHPVGCFSELARPDVLDDRADRALSYCGIARADLLAAPDFLDVRARFDSWLKEHAVNRVWSYNRAFDEGMLLRSGVSLPWEGCVMRLARQRMPHRAKDPPLREASMFFLGFEPDTAHRALSDARTAAQVLAVLLRT